MPCVRYFRTTCVLFCAAFLLQACSAMLPRHDAADIMQAGPQDKFVRVKTCVSDVNIHYREYTPRGKNVVLIHGFASSTYSWDEMAEELRKSAAPGEALHIWALDLKGFGWSDKPRGSKYDTLTLSNVVYAWMNAVGIDRATLVGNSLGGAIALVLAIDHPEKVDSLVLVDSGGYQASDRPGKFALSPLTLASGWLNFNRSFVKKGLDSAFYDQNKVTEHRVEEYYKRLTTRGCLDAQLDLVKTLDPEIAWTYTGRLGGIRSKTLVIWGRDDRWIPLNHGCCFKSAIPNATLRIIPQCGHMPQEEQPAIVAGLLRDFLRGAPPESHDCACHLR